MVFKQLFTFFKYAVPLDTKPHKPKFSPSNNPMHYWLHAHELFWLIVIWIIEFRPIVTAPLYYQHYLFLTSIGATTFSKATFKGKTLRTKTFATTLNKPLCWQLCCVVLVNAVMLNIETPTSSLELKTI